MSFRLVRKFCNSSSTHVPRFLSSPFLILRSISVRNNLLPTTRTSHFHASISRCCPSVDSQTHTENTSRPVIESVLDSVVKVFSVRSQPSIIVLPWLNPGEASTGSGFVISGKRILTNAHVVKTHEDDSSYVQVKKHGSPTKYKAIVEAMGDECDLAILVVDNEEFWEDLIPLELGDIPLVYDTVSVVGYPRGGETISVTKGIVSRVEPRDYCHSSAELLTIQVDAAINKGNSGGPVFMGNKVAGVAFQGLKNSENINYVIPTPVIKHFLSGVEETGQYAGPGLPDITCQDMGNAQLRKHFKMNHEMTGILINEINPVSDAHKVLKKDDVILAIDGVPIGNDQTVPFRGKERIKLNHLVSMKKPGEKALFKVLRDGREHEFNISLSSVHPLDKVRLHDQSHYIFAGFIFVHLTSSYIDLSSGAICRCALKRMPEKASQQIVIISKVLLDKINIGYCSLENLQVKKVNGEEVNSLHHLRWLIKRCRTEDLRLDLEKGKVIVLNYKSAKEETSLILKRHSILLDVSRKLDDTFHHVYYEKKKVPHQKEVDDVDRIQE
ncbi:Protease Do-like 10 [Cardamine amara subsp. amara]|uniref:Protease Do-like 10 n=1 Tax=Cardamine amara subsp. amara TaxID=228776 RepID=A0ABD1AIP8_CARAN